jgi:arginine metabolism regulation protein II
MEEMSRLAQRNAAIPPFDHNRKLDDFLRVSPTESDRDHSIDDRKDFNTNLGDIHLTDSRSDPDELHSTVNGVSETWLGLLSQTTRLANVMDQINNGSCTMTADRQLALHRRSLYLENMICSLTSRKFPHSEGEPKTHMLLALNSALVVYFYRRVRRVNSCILQGYVTQIISELHQWDECLARCDMIGPGTAWPAFMAGCEAMDEDQRRSLTEWLDKASAQSGLASYSTARAVMEEVWKRKDGCSETTIVSQSHLSDPMSLSWTDLSRQNLHWLILC